MRHLRRFPGVVLSVLLLLVTAAPHAQVTAAGADADCSYNPVTMKSPREIYREVSRFAELVAPTPAADAVGGRRRASDRPTMPDFEARNFIDEEIFGKMKADGVMWTSRSTDQEFLRRVWIDLAGEIPDAQTVRDFLADTSADKRDRMIERLLNSDGFTDRWTMWLGDHVQNVQFAQNTFPLGPQGRNAYHTYLRNAMASKKPYDEIVRELISAAGRSTQAGQVNFWVRQHQLNGPIQDTYDNLASFAGEKFLGLPLVCLSCHSGIAHLELVNSSLARRSRADFWKSAAFFAETSATPPRGGADYVLADLPAGQGAYRLNTVSGNKTPRQPNPGESAVVAPAFFLNGESPRQGEPARAAFARILTAHPQFARATVNYLWKEIFGLGIVEPVDSFDLLRQDPATLSSGQTLQPTHPVLLTKLADAFRASGYDIRALMKLMVESNAYQLSSRYSAGSWEERFTPYYARYYPRRLMAEALYDSVVKATGVAGAIGVNGLAPVQRAMQLPDTTEGGNRSQFLNAFGRGDRDETRRTNESSIVQALALMNDRFVTDRIKASAAGSLVQRLTRQTQNPDEIVEGLYVATLSRFPTASERAAGAAYLRSGELVRKTEDLQYALLNKLEFLFN